MSIQSRKPAGSTGSIGGQFAEVARSEADVELSARAGTPFGATVRLQRWDSRDELIDVGVVDLDITGYLADLGEEGRVRLLENGGNSDVGDLIAEWARARGEFVHDGPFTVDFDEVDLGEWMDANPPWLPDGLTPHPTGGYVSVVRDDSTGRVAYVDVETRLHREDGPALVEEGLEAFYRHGLLHREDGPARVEHFYDGSLRRGWFVDGKPVAQETSTVEAGWRLVDGKPVRAV